MGTSLVWGCNQAITQGKDALPRTDINFLKSRRQISLKEGGVDMLRNVDMLSIVEAIPGEEFLDEVATMPSDPAGEDQLPAKTDLDSTNRHPHEIPGGAPVAMEGKRMQRLTVQWISQSRRNSLADLGDEEGAWTAL